MLKIGKIVDSACNLPITTSKVAPDLMGAVEKGEEKLLSTLDSLSNQNIHITAKSFLQKVKKCVEDYFSSHNYQKTQEGSFLKKLRELDNKDLEKISKKYGSSLFTKAHLCANVKMEDIIEVANVGGGKYLPYWTENPDELILLASRIKSPMSFQEGLLETNFLDKARKNPEIWDMAMDVFINPPSLEKTTDLLSYKGSRFAEINKSLISGDISEGTKKFIDSIFDTIQTREIKHPITVFRGEGPEILNSVMTDGGKVDLMKILSDAQKEGKLDTVIQDIIKSNPEVTQKAFMSTSLSDRFLYKTINWELEVKPGTKGIFMETLPTADTGRELEVLLQKDSKIKIKDIEFRQGKIPQWFIKGEVSN